MIKTMIPKLRELMDARPFRPFTVALADGRRLDVTSPDMIWMPPDGRGGLHSFLPEQDRIASVNPLLVTSMEHAVPPLEQST